MIAKNDQIINEARSGKRKTTPPQKRIDSEMQRFRALDKAYGRDNDLTSKMMSVLISNHKDNALVLKKKKSPTNAANATINPIMNIKTNQDVLKIPEHQLDIKLNRKNNFASDNPIDYSSAETTTPLGKNTL